MRDTVHAVGIALTVVFYATPIVYPLSLVPERLRPLIEANPLTHLVEWYRRAFTLPRSARPGSMLFVTSLSVAARRPRAWRSFRRARPHFADLI